MVLRLFLPESGAIKNFFVLPMHVATRNLNPFATSTPIFLCHWDTLTLNRVRNLFITTHSLSSVVFPYGSVEKANLNDHRTATQPDSMFTFLSRSRTGWNGDKDKILKSHVGHEVLERIRFREVCKLQTEYNGRDVGMLVYSSGSPVTVRFCL